MDSIATILYPKYCASEWCIKDKESFDIAILFMQSIARDLELDFKARCKASRSQQRPPSTSSNKFGPEIIEFALDLYAKKISIRDIAAQIEEKYDVTISHTTIPYWARKRGLSRVTNVEEKEGE